MSVHSDTTDVKRMDEKEPDGNEEEVDEEENWDDQASKTVMKGLVEKALKGYKAEIVCHGLEEASGKCIKKKDNMVCRYAAVKVKMKAKNTANHVPSHLGTRTFMSSHLTFCQCIQKNLRRILLLPSACSTKLVLSRMERREKVCLLIQ